jgi:CRP-like cAMP-binding protein
MRPEAYQIIDEFFSRYPMRRYKKGQVLILAGEKTPHAFYLIEGRIRVYDVTYRGEEIVVNSFKAPIVFPLPLIVHNSTTPYIYEASTDIVIRQAPVDETKTFLQREPTVVYDLLGDLYVMLDRLFERMVHAFSSSAKNRLVDALIDECREFGILQKDGSYVVAISERELGARAGLSRETISREAKALKATRLIEVHHSAIVIPDLERLEQYLVSHR